MEDMLLLKLGELVLKGQNRRYFERLGIHRKEE